MDKKTLEIQIKLLANQALSQVKEFGADIKNAADKAKGFTGDAKGVSTSIKTMQAEAQRTANQMKLFGLTSSDLRNITQNLKKNIDLFSPGLFTKSFAPFFTKFRIKRGSHSRSRWETSCRDRWVQSKMIRGFSLFSNTMSSAAFSPL